MIGRPTMNNHGKLCSLRRLRSDISGYIRADPPLYARRASVLGDVRRVERAAFIRPRRRGMPPVVRGCLRCSTSGRTERAGNSIGGLPPDELVLHAGLENADQQGPRHHHARHGSQGSLPVAESTLRALDNRGQRSPEPPKSRRCRAPMGSRRVGCLAASSRASEALALRAFR